MKRLVPYLPGGTDENMLHQHLYSWKDIMLRTKLEPSEFLNFSAPTFRIPWTGLIWLQWRSVVNKALNFRVP
jgi:hypothetical protein